MQLSQTPIPEYLENYRFPEYSNNYQYLDEHVTSDDSTDDSSLDAILNSKKDLILDKLRLLSNAIEHRRQISHDLRYSIDNDISKCQRHIFDLEHTSYFTMQREWEIKKFDLEKERRQELTSYFRDLTMIEKEIRDAQLELFKEKQTEDFFQ